MPAPCRAKSNSENGKIGDGPGSGPAMLQRDGDDRRDNVRGEIALLLAVSYGHAKSSNLLGTAWREDLSSTEYITVLRSQHTGSHLGVCGSSPEEQCH